MHPKPPGIENFRDFGGLALAGGRRVRKGRLFRSANLAKATEADAAAFRAAGITHVFDLRSADERGKQPCSPAFDGCIRLFDTGENMARVDAPDVTLDGNAHMKEQYRHMPFEEHHVAVFSRYFAELAEAPSAVLIHCAAGKDRTGILAALTLHMLGADMMDIKADYLLTNNRCIKERTAQVRAYMAERLGYMPTEEQAASALVADAAWLDSCFEAIAERCGSVDAYLEQVLGVTPARRAAIFAHTTEPA